MPSKRKKPDSKVQARLTFTPVSKDSEQAQQLPTSVRSRASAVRYFSPKKISTIQPAIENVRTLPKSIPRISQESNVKDVPRSQGGMVLKPRKWNAKPALSDAVDADDDTIHISQRTSSPGPDVRLPVSRRYSSQRSRGSSPQPPFNETDRISPQGSRFRRKPFGQPLRSSPPASDLRDDVEADYPITRAGTRARPQILVNSDDEDEEDMEAESPTKSRNERITALESEPEDEPVLPHNLRRRSRQSRAIINLKDDCNDAIIIESDDDDEQPIPSSTRMSLRSRNRLRVDSDEPEAIPPPLSLARSSTPSVSIPRNNEDDSVEEATLPSSTRRRLRSRNVLLDDDDDDEPIVTSSARQKRHHPSFATQHNGSSSPAKRRRLQTGPRPRKLTREELDEEVINDAADLQDTTTMNTGLRSASTLNSKKAARQHELNKLLKRRQKNTSTAQQSSFENGEDDDSSSDSDLDISIPVPYNDVYSDEDSSRADSLIDDGELSESNSESDELRINRCIYDLPSALYYVIRHLIYLKFLPPSRGNGSPSHRSSTTNLFPPAAEANSTSTMKENTFYLAAHTLISKRLEAYRNSYLSQIWRAGYVASLRSRPRLTWPSNELNLWESCEACGKSNRPATYVIRFEGSRYDEWDLTVVASESDDENGDADNEGEEDGGIHERETQRSWHIGADCHDNTVRAHRAAHWRIGLSQQVDRALCMMGVVIDPDAAADAAEQEAEKAEQLSLAREDRYHAVLLQMEEQGYMTALQNEFLERFEMADGDGSD